MKSSMAIPSLRNSGLLATSTSRPVSSFSRAATSALVPTGTVLLQTTMASGPRCGASRSTTDQRAVRSTDPLSAGGVPTARNTSRAFSAAAARSTVNCSRPPATLRATNSASPGS